MLRDGLRGVGEDGEHGASHGEMTVDLAIVQHDGIVPEPWTARECIPDGTLGPDPRSDPARCRTPERFQPNLSSR